MSDLDVLEAVAWRWRNRLERYGIAGATAGDWYYEARDPAFAPHSDKETEPLVRKSDADAIARERDAMREALEALNDAMTAFRKAFTKNGIYDGDKGAAIRAASSAQDKTRQTLNQEQPA